MEHVANYSLERKDALIRGWLVNPQYAKKRVIVYFGGNAEDVFYNVEEFEDIQAATLLVAYRGYGPSTGQPGENELYQDGLAIVDDILERYHPEKLLLFGRSLGSGIACYCAAHRRVAGVVLITPYDSIENVAGTHYPWLPVTFLLRHKFNSQAFAPAIESPVLVLYGDLDTVVPPSRTENLLTTLPRGTRSVLVRGADHGSISMFPLYWQEILEFIENPVP